MSRPAAPGSCYFFLSYAPPLPPRERIRGDYWERVFYHDLLTAVTRQTGLKPPLPGFAELTLPPGADRQEAVRDALAAAEVFVPLYSPDYLARPEQLSERASFRHKLVNAGQSPDGDHILPVLWSPLHTYGHLAEREHALVVAGDVDDYARNGMSVLCRVHAYRRSYADVLERVAARIVAVAEQTPLRPTEAMPLIEVARPEPDEVPFLATFIAPTLSNLPAGNRESNGYGAGFENWHPFPGSGPLADDVTDLVQRLHMPIEIREFRPDAGMFLNCPGLLVLDPWILTTASGPEIVRSALGCLQNWVGVVVVVDRSDPAFRDKGSKLLDEVVQILRTAASPATFTDAIGWRRGVPSLVERMRRRYLRDGPSFPPAGPPQAKPRLADPPTDRT
jgi:FxsC-like protein